MYLPSDKLAYHYKPQSKVGPMHSQLTNYLESNLKLLKKNHPAVYRQMTENPPKPVGRIVIASNGKPNLEVINSEGQAILLHNPSAPEKEGSEYLKKIPENHRGFVGILGTGLGYAALDIPKNRPKLQKLALFELEPGIFIQAMKYMDLSPVLTDSRVILCIGIDIPLNIALSSSIKTLQLEAANAYEHHPSFKFNTLGYQKLKKDLFAHLNSENVGGQTTLALGKDFLNNRFEHVCTIHHHLLLEQIQNKFTDVPAILVAGGPSLDKNIHLLKKIQENAIIIAVDTVLPALIQNGVHPNFLTCIDPNNITFEKFADVLPKVRNTALICSSWVNLKTPKIFPAEQIFWTFTAKPIEAWINTIIGGKLLTGGASTVAHLNIIAAHILGCEPVVFVGQDLAYPSSGTTHVKGTVLHASAPQGIINGNDQSQTTMGIDGRLIRTDRAFLSMKDHFENMIRKSDKTHINATEGGAHIDGTQVMPLQEVIDRYCSSPGNITKRLKGYNNTLDSSDPILIDSIFNKIINKINIMESINKKVDSLIDSILADLKNPKKISPKINSFSMLPLKKQNQIIEIDKYNQQLDNEIDIWKILEEITMEGLKQSERQKQDISRLANNTRKYRLWLTKNIEMLKNVSKIRKETLTLLKANLEMVISFHQQEAEYSETKDRLGLAKLYIDSGNYYLAKNILEKYVNEVEASAEVYFFIGSVAAHSCEQEAAEEYFNKAISLDKTIGDRIVSFRQAMGDEFMKFVNYFKPIPGRKASVEYSIKKGLSHCLAHDKLNQELAIILRDDLKNAENAINSNNYIVAAPIVKKWYKTITERELLTNRLADQLVGNIFLFHGKLMIVEKNYAQGISDFKKALQYRPKDSNLHQIIIEKLFENGSFTEAIEALKSAIAVDKEFAAYWESIGDTLASNGQHEDAILAYENCFIHLPENINLLKKIGECYLAADQLEAAKAALENYKAKLEQMPTGIVKPQQVNDSKV